MLKHFIKIKSSKIDLVKKGFVVSASDPQSQHLQSITHSFALGFNSAINNGEASSEKINLNKQGFYHEGSSMAFSFLDSLCFNKPSKSRVLQNIFEWPEFSYLKHVGVGWTFAKIPWARKLLFNELDPIRRWLAIDGWGFHDAFFKTEKTLALNVSSVLEKEERKVYLQGIGRALWFIKSSDPQLILKFINQCHCDYRSALWSGVGLAATYAGYHQKNAVSLEQLKSFSGAYLLNLQQGVAFAATAAYRGSTISEETIYTCKVLTGRKVTYLVELCDLIERDLPRDGKVNTYLQWQDQISAILNEDSYSV